MDPPSPPANNISALKGSVSLEVMITLKVSFLGWHAYDPRSLHKRDVHIEPLVVRRTVSTLGSIRIHAQRASAPSQPLVVCKQYQELSEGLHDTESQKACLLSADDKPSLPMVLPCQPWSQWYADKCISRSQCNASAFEFTIEHFSFEYTSSFIQKLAAWHCCHRLKTKHKIKHLVQPNITITYPAKHTVSTAAVLNSSPKRIGRA
mgnify:CR=1 FL=1